MAFPLPPCRSHEANKREFIATMDAIDSELGTAGGPFFLGAELSLPDCVFAPMLERIAASIPYYKGFIVRGQGCVSIIITHAMCCSACMCSAVLCTRA